MNPKTHTHTHTHNHILRNFPVRIGSRTFSYLFRERMRCVDCLFLPREKYKNNIKIRVKLTIMRENLILPLETCAFLKCSLTLP